MDQSEQRSVGLSGRHSKTKLMFEACRFDHKSDEVPVACTNEVHKKDESQDAMEPNDDA